MIHTPNDGNDIAARNARPPVPPAPGGLDEQLSTAVELLTDSEESRGCRRCKCSCRSDGCTVRSKRGGQ